MALSGDQLQRYSRHIILPEVGAIGQERLLAAKVFIVGAGGLGSPVAYYLAAAGVGHLGIIDNDAVELSNLQRQIVHSTKTLGMPKVYSAKDALEALNPDSIVSPIQKRLTRHNIVNLIKDYDIIVDCSDNFSTRFLVNDACVIMKKILVSGAILKFEGQLTTILPGEGHCYRCLFEDMPPAGIRETLQTAGLVGAVPGVIGTLQALEVIKLILGAGQVLKERLLIFDGLSAKFRRIKVRRNPECPVCGEAPRIISLLDQDYGASVS
jgi:molybdopterin/thiamine biosynthesis adenylyltransferase